MTLRAAFFLPSLLAFVFCFPAFVCPAQTPAPTPPGELPDITSVPADLVVPAMEEGSPAPGKRVKQVAAGYEKTDVFHTLYLPTDWKPGVKYPVIVEYNGNGPWSDKYGDLCTGRVEDAKLGYGLSGGKGFIWISLPFISPNHRSNQLWWWGDVDATAGYCKAVVPKICGDYGGDTSAVFLAGFSRGSIACNFIGLHDDAVASLWCGFICHSHYDGVTPWPYAGSDHASAAERFARLKNRPQFISQEKSIENTRRYLHDLSPDGPFTLVLLPYRNHTDLWVLRDIPERAKARQWIAGVLGKKAAGSPN